jgi:hypothetical protein
MLTTIRITTGKCGSGNTRTNFFLLVEEAFFYFSFFGDIIIARCHILSLVQSKTINSLILTVKKEG